LAVEPKLKQMIMEKDFYSFTGIFKGDRVDQSLDIKSLRRRTEGAKTVETKAQATGALAALVLGVYMLCLFIVFKVFCL
jgi:hypothetical protein